jgi:hypothetical protein
MNKIFYVLTLIAAAMLAAGIALPFLFALALGGYNWPPVVWNVLQLGGLVGAIVCGLGYRFTKPRRATPSDSSETAAK